MKYELAKKLKDAGFPVKDYRCAADIFKGGFVEPTLSELIEACGEKGFNLGYGGIWRAIKEYGYDFKNKVSLYKSGDGKTPEEAVANLWLELNNK